MANIKDALALFHDGSPMPESVEHMKMLGGSKCGSSVCPALGTKWCKKCQVTPYCSVECQRAAWKEDLHKAVCKANTAPLQEVEELYRKLEWQLDFRRLRESMLAMCMGLHNRLGASSVLLSTNSDFMKVLFEFLVLEEYKNLHAPFDAVHVPALGDGNLGNKKFRRQAQRSLEGLASFPWLDQSKQMALAEQFDWSFPGGELVQGYTGWEGTYYSAAFDDSFQASQPTNNPIGACLFNAGARGSIVVYKLRREEIGGEANRAPISRAEVFNLAMARLASVVHNAVTDRMWSVAMKLSVEWGQERAWNLTPPKFQLEESDEKEEAGGACEGGGGEEGQSGAERGGSAGREGKGLSVGAWVIISGLTKAAELNGQVGTVSSGVNAEGRVAVAVDECWIPGGQKKKEKEKKVVRVRVGNLEAVGDEGMTSVVRMGCDAELHAPAAHGSAGLKVELVRLPRAHWLFQLEGPGGPRGEASDILELAGFPVRLVPCPARVPLRQRADYDNQWATFLMIEPTSGFAPPHWQSHVGPVLAFRPGGAPLSDHDVIICFEFADALLDQYNPGDPNAVRPERDITAGRLARAARGYVGRGGATGEPLRGLSAAELKARVHVPWGGR